MKNLIFSLLVFGSFHCNAQVTLVKAPHESSDYSFELWRFSDRYAAHLNSLNLKEVMLVGD